MSDNDGLICAVILDGKGGGREIGWPEIENWNADQGILCCRMRCGPVS